MTQMPRTEASITEVGTNYNVPLRGEEQYIDKASWSLMCSLLRECGTIPLVLGTDLNSLLSFVVGFVIFNVKIKSSD